MAPTSWFRATQKIGLFSSWIIFGFDFSNFDSISLANTFYPSKFFWFEVFFSVNNEKSCYLDKFWCFCTFFGHPTLSGRQSDMTFVDRKSLQKASLLVFRNPSRTFRVGQWGHFLRYNDFNLTCFYSYTKIPPYSIYIILLKCFKMKSYRARICQNLSKSFQLLSTIRRNIFRKWIQIFQFNCSYTYMLLYLYIFVKHWTVHKF